MYCIHVKFRTVSDLKCYTYKFEIQLYYENQVYLDLTSSRMVEKKLKKARGLSDETTRRASTFNKKIVYSKRMLCPFRIYGGYIKKQFV